MALSLSVERITEGVLSPLVQQFLANEISALKIFAHFSAEMASVPILRHSFPYAAAVLQEQARGEVSLVDTVSLREVLASSAASTGWKRADLERELETRVTVFQRTQDAIQTRRVLSRPNNFRAVVEQIGKDYPSFNALDQPRHKPELMEMVRHEGLEAVTIENLNLLCACASHVDRQTGAPRHRFYVKEGLHPALEEFLIAHELSHWWLHMDRGKAIVDAEARGEHFYLHSFHDWGRLENEADSLALMLLFPTLYLSWCDIEERLEPDAIFADFTTGMVPPRSLLRERMRHFIEQRIADFEAQKDFLALRLQKGLSLPNGSIPKRALHGLKVYLDGYGYRWAELDATYQLRDCSTSWAELFGATREDLRQLRPHVVNDLTPPKWRQRVSSQLERKRKERTARLYVAAYQHPATGTSIPVALNAFAIRDEHDSYEGSFGIATPIDGLEGRGALAGPERCGKGEAAIYPPIALVEDTSMEAKDYNDTGVLLVEEPENLEMPPAYRQLIKVFMDNLGTMLKEHADDYVAIADGRILEFSNNETYLIEKYYLNAKGPVLIRRIGPVHEGVITPSAAVSR